MTTKQAILDEVAEKILELIDERFTCDDDVISVTFSFDSGGNYNVQANKFLSYEFNIVDEGEDDE